jgi:hypothetical protein
LDIALEHLCNKRRTTVLKNDALAGATPRWRQMAKAVLSADNGSHKQAQGLLE